jgi:hypothetical protein
MLDNPHLFSCGQTSPCDFEFTACGKEVWGSAVLWHTGAFADRAHMHVNEIGVPELAMRIVRASGGSELAIPIIPPNAPEEKSLPLGGRLETVRYAARVDLKE